MATSERGLVAHDGRGSAITRLLIDHPVTSYFVLAFVGAWLCLLPIVLSTDGLGLVPFQTPFPLFVALYLLASFAGPTLAAVLVTLALEGRAGLGPFFRRYVQWRVGVVPYVLALLGFPLIWLVAMTALMGAAGWQALLAQPLTFVTTYLPAVLFFPGLITWGEEPGWRGFAQTRLQERHRPVLAALLVGFLHGVWHLPNFLMTNGPTAAGPFNPVNFIANIVVVLFVTIIFTWVFNTGRQSILIAVLVHASFNATGAWLGGMVEMPQAVGWAIYGLYALVAVVLVVATRGRLGYKPAASAPAPVVEGVVLE